jgi:hypothetical protein
MVHPVTDGKFHFLNHSFIHSKQSSGSAPYLNEFRVKAYTTR